MNWVKIQRRARSRMKDCTGSFSEDRIGAARFVATYYSNFLIGMGASVLGSRGGK